MEIKELFNPTNWVNYAYGQSLYGLWLSNPTLIPTYMMEQIAFRAYLCRDCLRNITKKKNKSQARCLGCGCAAPNLMFAPTKQDKWKRWEKWRSDVIDWITFKSSGDERWKEFQDYMDKAGVSYFDRNLFDVLKDAPGEEPDYSKPRKREMSVRRTGYGVRT